MVKSSLQLYKNAYMGLPPRIWWLAVVIFVNRSGTMVIPFLTVYLLQKGFTVTDAGYVMGAFGLGTIVGGFTGGKLTDRYHFFHVQFFSLFLNGIMFIILAQMRTFTEIVICIFVLSSLGEAFRPANAAAIAAYSNESNRTRSYSLNRLAINLGWSIGPAIGGILASINYKLLFWADGVTCMAASVLLFFVLKPADDEVRPAHAMEKLRGRSAVQDKIFMQGMFCLFLVGFCFFQVFSIVPMFYKSVARLNEATIGGLLALNGIIIVLFEMVLVYKLEKGNRFYEYMIAGTFLIGVSFITFNISVLLPVLLLNILLITLGEMLLFPFLNTFWVKRSNETNRGAYAAIFTISFAVAQVLAPSLASQIASASGFHILWWINFAICSIAAAGFWMIKKQQQHG